MGQRPLAFHARTPVTQLFDDSMASLLRERSAQRDWVPQVELQRVWDLPAGIAGSGDIAMVSREAFAQALGDSCSVSSFSPEDAKQLREQLESLCELTPNYLDEAKISLAFSSDAQGTLSADPPGTWDTFAFLTPSFLEGVVEQLWEHIASEGCVSTSAQGTPTQYCAAEGDTFTFGLRLMRPHVCGWQGGQSVVVAYTIMLRFSGAGAVP